MISDLIIFILFEIIYFINYYDKHNPLYLLFTKFYLMFESGLYGGVEEWHFW